MPGKEFTRLKNILRRRSVSPWFNLFKLNIGNGIIIYYAWPNYLDSLVCHHAVYAYGVYDGTEIFSCHILVEKFLVSGCLHLISSYCFWVVYSVFSSFLFEIKFYNLNNAHGDSDSFLFSPHTFSLKHAQLGAQMLSYSFDTATKKTFAVFLFYSKTKRVTGMFNLLSQHFLFAHINDYLYTHPWHISG